MIYIAFTVFTVLILMFALYQMQFFMLFTPVYVKNRSTCKECQELSVVTDDAKELEGVVYEPHGVTHTLLVFVGRSHDAVALVPKLAECYRGCRIVSFNYRGYGRSEGVADEKTLLQDGVKIATLVQKHYGEFCLLGFSIGSSVAAYVATQTTPKAVFLLGAFDSVVALAKKKYGRFLPDFVFRYRFETIEFVQYVEAPVYLFVSEADEIVYIENARTLKSGVKNLALYKEYKHFSHKELLWEKEVCDTVCLECLNS